jgi:hypothetical protein
MVRFEFTASPSLDRVAFALAEYADTIDDWRPAFREIEKLFYAHERNLFRTIGKGRSRDQWPQWEALSDRGPRGGYKAYKKRVRPGRPILVFDGTLRRAATGGSGAIKGRITKTSMLVGINPNSPAGVVGRAHATGNPARNLPARPPIRFDPDTQRRGVSFGYAVSQIVQSYLVLKRKEAMRRDPEVLKRIRFGNTAAHHKSRIKSILRKSWR